MGVIFSPKSPCGLKSNLSDITYDGLKQVSVFKALKVMWEKWIACTDHTPCLICLCPRVHFSISRLIVMKIEQRDEWSWCAWIWMLFFVPCTWFYTCFDSCVIACKSLILHLYISKGAGNVVVSIYGWINCFCSIYIKREILILLQIKWSLCSLIFIALKCKVNEF